MPVLYLNSILPDLNLKKCFYEFNRINIFIKRVQGSEMRMILTLKYTQKISRKRVALTINYQDEIVQRKRHYRFLRKTKITDLSELKAL